MTGIGDAVVSASNDGEARLWSIVVGVKNNQLTVPSLTFQKNFTFWQRSYYKYFCDNYEQKSKVSLASNQKYC